MWDAAFGNHFEEQCLAHADEVRGFGRGQQAVDELLGIGHGVNPFFTLGIDLRTLASTRLIPTALRDSPRLVRTR